VALGSASIAPDRASRLCARGRVSRKISVVNQLRPRAPQGTILVPKRGDFLRDLWKVATPKPEKQDR
jgi:hypothetical protein